jgi:ABC-type dipeptide/oligopeptide/nickel transport system permease subunit
MTGSKQQQRRSSRLNFPLALGILLVGLLGIVALLGPVLAAHDPMESYFLMEDRNGELQMPPFEPGQIAGFPLGSDLDGRDILSRLIHAVRPTLILAVFISTIRLVVGTVLGFLGGWRDGLVSDLAESATRVALAIPILIFAIVVIYILGFRFEAWVFIIALTLTGWANTSRIMSERARVIRGEDFVEAARAVGAREGRLLRRHLLPQVRTLVIVTWTLEMGVVLLQLAELGFLGFFMGGGAIRLIPDPNSGAFFQELISGQPELGQMLSAGWSNFLNAPRIALYAGTAFFFAIFAFLVLGEGLRRYYSEKVRLG